MKQIEIQLVRVSGTPEPPPPPPPPSNVGVFKTRGYGDPVMIELDNLDTRQTGPNFNHVDLYNPDGGWGAVAKWQRMDRQAMDYLISLQPPDPDFTRTQKVNWFIGNADDGKPSRPYWTKGADWRGDWTSFHFGTIVFGHQLIKVETEAGKPKEYTFWTRYPAKGANENIVFYKLEGMRRSEIGKYTHESHPWFIQKATAANAKPAPNTIDYEPRGVLYHPVWSPIDWRPNYGAELFIARAFLVT